MIEPKIQIYQCVKIEIMINVMHICSLLNSTRRTEIIEHKKFMCSGPISDEQ